MLDEHTDFKLNYIEKRIYFATECLHAEIPEEKIIDLLGEKCSEEHISLILAAAKMLYQDEITDFKGD